MFFEAHINVNITDFHTNAKTNVIVEVIKTEAIILISDVFLSVDFSLSGAEMRHISRCTHFLGRTVLRYREA